jgi:hypothetical protein
MMPRLELGQTFPTILIARDAINRSVIDNGESYKIHTSNARVYIIQCRDARNSSYSFYIHASLSKKSSVVSIVTLRSSHSYSPHAIVGSRSLGKDPYLLLIEHIQFSTIVLPIRNGFYQLACRTFHASQLFYHLW